MSSYTRITLNDIAKALNVTKVTVSKALRDHPDIGTEMKQKVRDFADQHGYVPNFIARNLSAKRSNTIGLVVPKIAHHFFASAIETIYETAYKNGYEVILTVSQENREYEIKHIQTLLSMHVDGLLLSVSEQTKKLDILDMVKKRHIPLVFFDRILDNTGFSSVTADDEAGSYAAVSHLIESGYRRIAHIAGFAHANIGRNRSTGYERALQDHNIEFRKQWVVKGGFSEDDGYHGFMQLFRSGKLPQVIYAVTYPVALGIIVAAEEVGLSIPDDLDIICFGGSIYNRFVRPSLSYIDQPSEEIARVATNLLLDEIASPDTKGVQHVRVPTQLVMCDTCLPCDPRD